MTTRSLPLALALMAGCAGVAVAEAPQSRPPAPAAVIEQDRDVGTLLSRAEDDRAAFQAAIDTVPPGGQAVISVPDIGRPWRLPGAYLDPGDRHITWDVDPGVTINDGKPVEWMRLNGPVTTGRGVLAYGFGNKDDNTGFRILVGGGGVFANPEAGISGFKDVQEQAYKHERGRAALYMSVSDAGQLGIDGAGIASHDEITLPKDAIQTNVLRVGMFVDAPGTTFPTIKGEPWRYTTRVTGWRSDGPYATALEIDGWYRSNPKGNAAVRETPSVDRKAKTGRVLVNPLNKIWGSNLNLFLNKADAPPFEQTSGAFAEWAVFNNTGADFSPDFQQNIHPLHFYGVDLANNGKNGGGTGFQVRGTQPWEYGFRVKSGRTGFQVEGTRLTDGGTGFATTETTAGGPDVAFAARTMDREGASDSYATIMGKAPELHLGRTTAASTPALVLHSGGGGSSWDARLSAEGGGADDGAAALTVEAGAIVLDARGGPVILRNLPEQADGLPSGALYRDTEGFVKVAP
jgi:hypothetical protein